MAKFIPNENSTILFATVAPGGLTPPTPTSATATTGGSLVAASYFYRVSAINALGESLAGPEVTQVVPAGTSTNTVTLTIPAVTGETGGFNIYGRTVGAERKIGYVAHSTTTFVDTGAVTPAGILPRSDKSATLAHPSLSRDIATAVNLTDLTMSLNFSAQGNAVPTPTFDTLFETSIDGTSQATATADFYRDDEDDLAWNTLPRGTKGFFLISRYGGIPVLGSVIETWPVTVLSRAVSNMASNTAVSFTMTCSVPVEPAEDGTVVA